MNNNKKLHSLRVFHMGEDVGEINIDNNCEFKATLPLYLVAVIEEIRDNIKKNGVSDIGDLYYTKKVKIPNEYLFPTLWRELQKVGIEFRLPKLAN